MFYIDHVLNGFRDIDIIKEDTTSYIISNKNNNSILLIENENVTLEAEILKEGFTLFIYSINPFKLSITSLQDINYSFSLDLYNFYHVYVLNNIINVHSNLSKEPIISLIENKLLNTDSLEEGILNLYLKEERLNTFFNTYLKNTDYLPSGLNNSFYYSGKVNCHSILINLILDINEKVTSINNLTDNHLILSSILKEENLIFDKNKLESLEVKCNNWYDPNTLNYNNDISIYSFYQEGFEETLGDLITVTSITTLENSSIQIKGTTNYNINSDLLLTGLGLSYLKDNDKVLLHTEDTLSIPSLDVSNNWTIESSNNSLIYIRSKPIKGIVYIKSFDINNSTVEILNSYVYLDCLELDKAPDFTVFSNFKYTPNRDLIIYGTCNFFSKYYKIEIFVSNGIYNFNYPIYLESLNWSFKLPYIYNIGEYNLTLNYFYQDRLLLSKNSKLFISYPEYNIEPVLSFSISNITETLVSQFKALSFEGVFDPNYINSNTILDSNYTRSIFIGQGVKYSIVDNLLVVDEGFEEVSIKYYWSSDDILLKSNTGEGASFKIFHLTNTFEIYLDDTIAKQLLKSISRIWSFYLVTTTEIPDGIPLTKIEQVTINLDDTTQRNYLTVNY